MGTAPAVAVARAAPSTAKRSAHILVVDDVKVNQLIVEAFLKAAGHQTTVVDNGAEAVEAVVAKWSGEVATSKRGGAERFPP